MSTSLHSVIKKYLPVLAFLALTVILVASCATDAVTGKSTFNYYTLDDEVKLGRQTLQANEGMMKKEHVPINKDRARVAQLNQMVDRLAAVSDLPQLPYNVTLFQTNIVNAAAAPGGSMMVFAGLYDPEIGLVKDDDELAAVMAHEIGHVNCRHVTERLSKLIPFAMLAEVGAVIADQKDKEGLATGIRAAFAVGTALWIPAYTRQDEAEADHVGMLYMARAGYDPRGAVRIWKRAAEKAGKKQSTSIFATHPSDMARYRALNNLLPQAMDVYAKTTGSYPPDYTPGTRLP